jgi:hypothetical protein
MKVKATKMGFDGETLRNPGEEFFFEGFKVNEDGTNNLGSWMEALEDLPKAKKRAPKKAVTKDPAVNLEKEDSE